ncbi:MAG: phosphotransferase [Pseudomonadota bacterium]
MSTSAEAPALMALASNPPVFSEQEARHAAVTLFGIDADAEPKSSERDRNFRVNAGSGADIVLKVCNVNEDPAVIDFQIAALRHIESTDPSLPVPRVVMTHAGEARTRVTSEAGEELMVFALTYCPGVPLREMTLTPPIMRAVGSTIAKLGLALRSFERAAPDQALVWDIRRADAMRQHLALIGDGAAEEMVRETLDRFAAQTLPTMAGLRHQVIHNDANRGNILAVPGDDAEISGVIDFGDMVDGPLIQDVSTAAMELTASSDDPISFIEAFLESYAAVNPLSNDEVACIYDCVMIRLAVCVLVYAWRDAFQAESRYDAKAEAMRFFDEMKRVDAVGRDAATERFHTVCGTG